MRCDIELFVPSIELDRSSRVPLHRQIYREIARAIRSGVIRHDLRLPSTRVMARVLRVSRNTVLSAYDELAADDLIRGERGSGMRVNGTGRPSGELLSGLQHVIRGANYPAKVLGFTDPNGNPLYFNL